MSASALRALPEESAPPMLADAPEWIGLTWPGLEAEQRHSRRVALLKRLLPAVGVALLLLIMMWPRLAPLWERMRFAIPAIDLREARELRMVNPRYAGTDRLGRPFVVTAAVGRQVPDRQDLMSLEQPHADLKTHGGADVVVTAVNGVYQAQAQLLDLFGEVTLAHQNGTRLLTDSARIDIPDNTAEGADPVTGSGPSGDVKAEGFRVADRGDTIFLTGKSSVLLRQAKPGTEKTEPTGLPTPVAAMAAIVPGSGIASGRPTRASAHQPAPAKSAAQVKPALKKS